MLVARSHWRPQDNGGKPPPWPALAVAPDSSLDVGSVAKGSVCPAGHPGGVSSHGAKNISISDIH